MARVRQDGSGAAHAPARRQARGERRIEQILEAAGRVFAEAGYNRATTNAIAAEAGISPGSLYQFFANKEQIASALEERYAAQVRATQERAQADLAGLPLETAIDRLIDPVVEHAWGTPGFHALFAERPMPDHLVASSRELHGAMVGRLEQILREHHPEMEDLQVHRRTLVAVQICRAIVPLIAAAPPAARAALTAELKLALLAYLRAAL